MLPMMTAIQYICAKIGLVSGRGLAGVLREHYPRWVLYPAVLALVIANTLNAGADIGAIAAAINLLVPIPAIVFIVPISVGHPRAPGLRRLPPHRDRLQVARPRAARLHRGGPLRPSRRGRGPGRHTHPDDPPRPQFIGILVALLGTTISPYLFFWQASHEVEEQISIGRRQLWQRQGASRFELKYALWDTLAGMIFSEVVAVLHHSGHRRHPLRGGQDRHRLGHRRRRGPPADRGRRRHPAAGRRAHRRRCPCGADPDWLGRLRRLRSVRLELGTRSHGDAGAPVLWRHHRGHARRHGDQLPRRQPHHRPRRDRDHQRTDRASHCSCWSCSSSNDRPVMGERTNGRLLNVLGWGTTIVMGAAAVGLIATTILG